MMSGIRGKNTRPELQIRRKLHAAGYRYRLHDSRLKGRPDLVFPSRRAAIFVHGCFWHGHDCPLFKWPKTRPAFWREKILYNRGVDDRTVRHLLAHNWRVLVVWECALKGSHRHPEQVVIQNIISWLESQSTLSAIQGSGHAGDRPVRLDQ